MKSITTTQFWKRYEALPADVQRRAGSAYRLAMLSRGFGLEHMMSMNAC
jgi:hypothetical protein